MKTYLLPDDFLSDSDQTEDQVIIRHYKTAKSTLNNKIILNRNMINLIITGSKTVAYPDQTAVVKENELVVLSTGNILTSELLCDQTGFTSLLLYFSNNALNHFLIKYNKLSEKKQVSKPFLIYQQDTYIKQYVNSLLTLMESASPLSREIKELKLEELLLYLNQIDNKKLLSLQIVSPNQNDLTIRKIVERHIRTPATIEQIAFLCNMSTSTFKRKFENLYGQSPQKWLVKQRLELAAEILKSGVEIPSQVYYKAGYKNHSSFSAAFRKYFGFTPSEYQAKKLNVIG